MPLPKTRDQHAVGHHAELPRAERQLMQVVHPRHRRPDGAAEVEVAEQVCDALVAPERRACPVIR
jgi:hypothetical protein